MLSSGNHGKSNAECYWVLYKGAVERWLNQREDTPVKMPVGLRCDLVKAQECHTGQACSTEADALVPMCLESILAQQERRVGVGWDSERADPEPHPLSWGNTQGPLSHLHRADRISLLAILRTLAGVQTSNKGQTLTWANTVQRLSPAPLCHSLRVRRGQM